MALLTASTKAIVFLFFKTSSHVAVFFASIACQQSTDNPPILTKSTTISSTFLVVASAFVKLYDFNKFS